MLTKKITEFSADLLDTVRGVLGEAKKCNDCGCAKCECEDDEDEMEEGYVPTADEPSDAAKKTAQKVRDMLAKEKKPAKETKDIPFKGPYRKTGERKDQYGNTIKNVAKHLAKKAMKANEEVEGLDEISKETKASYMKKAGADINKHWDKSKTDARSAYKYYGRKNTMKKIANEEAEGLDEAKYFVSTGPGGHLVHKKIDTGKKDAGGQTLWTSKVVKKFPYGDSQSKQTSADQHTAAYAHAEKMNSGVKEEVDQIDEISKATMGRYINKAKGQIDTASYRQGANDSDMSSPRYKNLEKKLTKRHKGIETAVSKLTKEEQDFIDALNDDMFEEIEIAEANLKVGDYTASSKKSKFHDKGYRPHLKNPQGKTSYLSSAAYKSPEHAAGEAAAYHRGYTSGPGGTSERGADVAVRAYRHKNKEHMHEEMDMPKGLEDRAPRGRARNAMGRAFAKKERNLARARKERALNKEAMDYRDGDTRMGSVGPITTDAERRARAKKYLETNLKKRKDNNDKAIKDMKKMGSHMRNPHFGEEAEQIDELSKNTMLRYVSANKKSASGGMGDREATKRMRGADLAVRKYTAKDNKYVRVPATEETEITEARGRPKKAGAKDFTIHPKTKEKLMHNNPEHMAKIERLQKNGILDKPKVEAGQHIMNQLSKAKTSMLGGSTIHFTHGDSKHVSGEYAAKLLSKYASMRPNEKEDFQKKIGHSHEQLMKHV